MMMLIIINIMYIQVMSLPETCEKAGFRHLATADTRGRDEESMTASPLTDREGAGSVRFGLVLQLSKVLRVGLVQFGTDNYVSRFDAVRPAVFRTRSGSVRFGSVRFRGRFRPVPKSNGSFRFGRFGSVSHSFL